MCINTELYKKVYLIRQSEQAIKDHYFQDKMKTPMHMSEGSEAIVAGVCSALGEQDQVFGTYRTHALYLSKTGDTDGFFAEMYGKVTGVAKGKAGSMHLARPEKGYMGSSAIVGTTIPVAVGAAYANQQRRTGKMTAVFFGDGAVDEGVFWESINFACLKKIPILFILEDNDLAVHTPTSTRRGFQDICSVISNYDCHVYSSDSTDVEEIHDIALQFINRTKETGLPSFLHLKYYRYLEHVGVSHDFDQGYREEAEYHEWLKRDPVAIQRNKLLLSHSEEEIKKIEENIDKKIQSSVLAADAAPMADISETHKGIFCEND